MKRQKGASAVTPTEDQRAQAHQARTHETRACEAWANEARACEAWAHEVRTREARTACQEHISRRGFCRMAAGMAGAVAAWALVQASGCAPTGPSDGGSAGEPAASGVADGGSGRGAASASAGKDAGPTGSAAGDPAAPSAQDEAQSRAFFAFDTLVQITAYGADEALFDHIASDCARYEQLFSAHLDDSDISRINAAGGSPTEVDPDTADLLVRALELCELTGGAFDVTIGAASLLWDFENATRPDDAALDEAARHIDYHAVSVDGTTVTLSDPQARLDLGGVAKGWIAEAIERTLRDAGVTSALVNLGTSSIFALGTKPGGAPWVLGIRDPRADDLSTIMGTVRIAGRALVSSGLYDKHFVQDGVDYHHILDPKTGYPVQTDLSDVTVVLPSSFAGDVLSTALFVMGADEARARLEDNPGLEAQAMFIRQDGELLFTEGFVEECEYAEYDPAGA